MISGALRNSLSTIGKVGGVRSALKYLTAVSLTSQLTAHQVILHDWSF